MKYKITAFSAWVKPQEFFADSKEEMQQIKSELRDEQYRVEVEEITWQIETKTPANKSAGFQSFLVDKLCFIPYS